MLVGLKFNIFEDGIKNSELYKFFIVGFIGAALVLLFTFIFTQFIEIFYVISAAIAFEISQIWGFFANDRWTFSKIKKKSKTHVRFIKYNLFSLILTFKDSRYLIFIFHLK